MMGLIQIARIARRARGLLGACCAVAAAGWIVGTTQAASAADCGAALVTPAVARRSVNYVAAQVRDAHYHTASAPTDRSVPALARLSKDLSRPLSAAMLARRINGALGEAQDGHLRVEMAPGTAAGCATLPVAFTWTDDGLMALPGGGLPAGARIVSVGGRTLDELESLAAATIPHENVYWARSTLAGRLGRADTLATAGLATRDGSVDVVYATADGRDAHARLKATAPSAAARPWIGYDVYAADSTGVFRFQRCDPNDEFFATLGAFMREVKQHEIRKVVIDVRGNPGGDSSVALAVLNSLAMPISQSFSVDIRVSRQLLHDLPMFDPAAVGPIFAGVGLPAPAPDAREYSVPAPMVLGMLAQRLDGRTLEIVPGRALYVLTDGGTFSSASLFAVLVRDNHLGMLVGEATGNAATFNGSEIERAVPGIPYVLHLSTARLARPDPLAGPAPTLLPDLRAPATSGALRAGQDTAVGLIRRL